MEKKKTMFDQMPSNFAFWAGVVTSTAVFAVIGFIIMAALLLGGDGKSGSTTRTANTNAAAPTANANAGGGAAAVPSGTIDLASIDNFRGEGEYTIVEFSDLECPFCQRFHPTVEQAVEEFDGQVRWAYKHFPLTSIHPRAQEAAEATECAGDQGQYWEFIDYIFDNQSSLSAGAIDNAVVDLGLDADTFNDCLDSGTYTDKVNADTALAQSLGGRGTPFSAIVDADGNIVDTISGALPYETVKAQLEAILN